MCPSAFFVAKHWFNLTQMHKKESGLPNLYYYTMQMDPAYLVVPCPSTTDAAAPINVAAASTSGNSSSHYRATATATKRTKPPTTWANISAAVLESLRDLHLVLSLSGIIEHVSPNSAALLGYTPQQLIGTVLVDHVHDDDGPVYRDELREASSTGRSFRFYCRIWNCNDSGNAGSTDGDAVLSRQDGEVYQVSHGTFGPSAASSSLSSPSSPVQQYSVFEIHGRFHPPTTHRPVPAGIGLVATPPDDAGVFVLMARPQPLAQSSKLDSFLWLKMENERLTQQLAELKAEQRRDGTTNSDPDDLLEQQNLSSSSMPAPSSTSTFRRTSAEGFPWLDSTPSMTLTTGSALSSSASDSLFSSGSSSNSSITTTGSGGGLGTPLSPFSSIAGAATGGRKLSSGAAPIVLTTVPSTGISAAASSASAAVTASPTNTPTVMEGDVGIPFIVKALTGAGGIKKRAKHVEDYVCAWCSTNNSPEWRKGPAGPKSLCNACGLRYAKSRRKSGNGGGGSGNGGGGEGGSRSNRGPATGPDADGGAAATGGEPTTVGPVIS